MVTSQRRSCEKPEEKQAEEAGVLKGEIKLRNPDELGKSSVVR
ncbi:unnamed protein product [Arabidopsis halleri]